MSVASIRPVARLLCAGWLAAGLLGVHSPAAGQNPAATETAAAAPAPQPVARIGQETAGFDVTCFAASPQGDLVAVGSDDGNLRLWSLAAGKVVRSLAVTMPKVFIGAVAFSPDGKQLVLHADDERIGLWDVESGREVARCAEETPFVEQLCFASGGKLVGVVSEEVGFVWDTGSGKIWKSQQPVASLAFSPDGKTVALGFNTVRLADSASGRTLREHGTMEGRVSTLEFSKEGDRLLAVDAGCRGTVARVLTVATGEETVLGEKIRSEVAGGAFAPDGKTIVLSDGMSTATFWEVATAKRIGTLGGLGRYSVTLAYTPDAKRLLTGRSNNHFDLLIWDTAAMQPEVGPR